MLKTGPVDLKFTLFFLVSKLLLTIDKVGLKIFENNEMEYLQDGRVLVSKSDNFLRFRVENSLASIAESGISSLFIKYIERSHVSKYANDLKWNTDYFDKSNISNSTLLVYVMRWLQNGCLTSYTTEKCDLRLNEHNEKPVEIVDLAVAWLILIGLVLVSLLVFVFENAKNQFKSLIQK